MKKEKEIGRRVQWHRKNNGYTQEKLAEIVDVSTPTISRLENGEQMVGVLKLMQIAEALGVTADALLYEPKSEKTEVDEWDGRIIVMLDKYTARQKEYIWKVMMGLRELQSGE